MNSTDINVILVYKSFESVDLESGSKAFWIKGWEAKISVQTWGDFHDKIDRIVGVKGEE